MSLMTKSSSFNDIADVYKWLKVIQKPKDIEIDQHLSSVKLFEDPLQFSRKSLAVLQHSK